MADKKYEPLQSRLGFVRSVPEVNDKGWLNFLLSVNQNYDKDDPDRTVLVRVSVNEKSRFRAAAEALEKGDRVVVEGSYKETEGRNGRPFRDLTAFAIYRAVEVEEPDDL